MKNWMRNCLRWAPVLLAAGLTIIALSSCSKLGGGLRRDFDDGQVYSSGTSGGVWAERGLLDEEEDSKDIQPSSYAAVGHAERNPAGGDGSTEAQNEQGQQTWNTPNGSATVARSAGTQEYAKPRFKSGARAKRADFIDESTNEGSLWAPEGQTNYYFSKNKVRSVGDIVTITLDDQIVKDAATEIKRTLTKQEALSELGIAQQKLIAKKQGIVEGKDAKTGAATAPQAAAAGTGGTREPAAAAEKKDDGEIPEATMQDVDLASALEIKSNDTIMAEIVERYPNGNYKIRGTKKVLYKNGSPRLLTVVAIARGADISEEDAVNSGKLYEYRVEALR